MTNPSLYDQHHDDLPPLPSHVRSLDGQYVELHGAVWTVRASSDGGKLISIDWHKIAKQKGSVTLSSRAFQLYQHYVVYRIARKKGCTIQNDLACLGRLLQWMRRPSIGSENALQPPQILDWATFDERQARAFLDWTVANRAERGNDFSRLRTFYTWGVACEYRDFDPAVLRAFEGIRAPGNIKGHNVRFRHIEQGPLSPEEQQLLVDNIKAGLGSAHDRVVIMLHLELGLNPQATARMCNRHLKAISTSKGTFYQLDVPRVKKRTAYNETKRRQIRSELGLLLSQLQQGGPDDYLFYWLDSVNPERAVTKAMKCFVAAAGIISPRTGEPLVISARRLRYTIATDMAEDGASKFHIAEVLDHTDLQNVDVYTQTVSTIADSVAAATDGALLPLVRRFQGRIIESMEEQVVSDQPNQIIPAAVPHLAIPLLSTAGVGVCGRSLRREGLCPQYPPLSCYLCPSFAALHRGPHQEMLDAIDTFLLDQESTTDRRILNQLDEVRSSIREIVNEPMSSDATHPKV